MAKSKNPLLSFGATGTIADAITYSRRRQTNILQEKPIPTDPQSLAQTYQRWDYQDGISYWETLTDAQKQAYKSDGARFHMTGFAYFMRWYLKNLPDLAGRWRLDERGGAVAYDSSKNSNHGTIIGALHVPGYIDYALSFDGLNDFVNCGNDPSLNVRGAFTLITFFYMQQAHNGIEPQLIRKYLGAPERGFCIMVSKPDHPATPNAVRFYTFLENVGFKQVWSPNNVIQPGVKYFIAGIYDKQNMRVQVNDTIYTGDAATDDLLDHAGAILYQGSPAGAAWGATHGILDNPALYSRALASQQLNRWLQRTY